jgi:TonB-dependent starch-binding outer membrane protein SusC
MRDQQTPVSSEFLFSNKNQNKIMKKKQHDGDTLKYLQKTMRIMRLSLFLMVISTAMAFSATSYSQNTKLTLDLNNATVKEVIKAIEDQSEFLFFYQQQHVDLNRKVTMQVTDQEVETILNRLFAETNNIYVINDRQIVIGIEPRRELEKQMLSLKGNVKTLVEQPQQKEITGKVTDAGGLPLPGVSVIVAGTTTGTVTNNDGEFSLTIPDDVETLQFSFVGMRTQEIPIEGRTTFTVVMEEETIGIEEVVAIGYGTMKKSDLTGSVVRANIEAFRESPNVSILQSLQGVVPGLNIGQVNVAGEEVEIEIRGKTSIEGSSNPLIVVDGVIFRGNLIDLNPSDIETVDVLKDASSTAIYGSEAANGVLLITTKRGKGQVKPLSINARVSYAFNRPSNNVRTENRAQLLDRTENKDYKHSRLAPHYIEPDPSYDIREKFVGGNEEELKGYDDGTDTNWYDILRQDASTANFNVGITGSSKKNNYYVSYGRLEEKGFITNEKYNRNNIRINIDNYLTDWFTIGIQSFLSLADLSGENMEDKALTQSPLLKAYNEDGSWKIFPDGSTRGSDLNPLVEYANIDLLDKRLTLFGNIYAKVDIPYIKGLTYIFNYNYNYVNHRNYYFSPYTTSNQGNGYKDVQNTNNWTAENQLTYKREMGDHKIDVTLVAGREERSNETFRASGKNYTNKTLGYNYLQAGDPGMNNISSSAWEESSIYYMSRLFYSYKNKYMLTGTIRRDGFSGFGANEKFGIFPSGAFAWVPTEEAFMKNVKWLNYLKLRASYGVNGNRSLGRYETLAIVTQGYSFSYDGIPAIGQHITSLSNSDLTWEKTKGLNLAIDYGFFNNRLNGTIEYYDNKTNDLLKMVELPKIGSIEQIATNIGEISNHGLEFSVTGKIVQTPEWNWQLTFNFSRNRNKVNTILGYDNNGDGREDDLITENLFIGEPLNTIYGYNITGMWQLENAVFNDTGDGIIGVKTTLPDGSEVIYSDFSPGNYMLEDINGDGRITAAEDRKLLKYRDPSYRFSIQSSLSYRKWTLNMFFNSIQGGKDFYYTETDAGDAVYYTTYWTPANPNGKYELGRNPMGQELLQQRNFIRLQDLSLSRTFTTKLGINGKVYFSGKNLLIFTDWDGFDPETGIGLARSGDDLRPVMESYNFGIDILF